MTVATPTRPASVADVRPGTPPGSRLTIFELGRLPVPELRALYLRYAEPDSRRIHTPECAYHMTREALTGAIIDMASHFGPCYRPGSGG